MQTRFVVDALDPEQAATAVLDQYAAFAERASLPVAVRLETHLALDEIVSNLARHGRLDGGASTIEVQLLFDEEKLYVDVADDGVPFDPLAATAIIPADPLDLPAGEFWLALVRRFTEQLTYAFEDGKNHLSFRKRVPYTRLRRLMNQAAQERQRQA